MKTLNGYLAQYKNSSVLVHHSMVNSAFTNPLKGKLNLIGDDYIVLGYRKGKREICIPNHSIVGIRITEDSGDDAEDAEDAKIVAESSGIDL